MPRLQLSRLLRCKLRELKSRLGSLVRYIPHPVTVGFTCGIAVTIFASQLRDLGGLTLAPQVTLKLMPLRPR
jgi:MFS superfamily sulfate permease-like transporter